jgi:hypothetical protein
LEEERLVEAEREVAELSREQLELRSELETIRKQEYVEEQAREQLNLVQPGETVVLLPTVMPDVIGPEPPRRAPTPVPNWYLWWERVR